MMLLIILIFISFFELFQYIQNNKLTKKQIISDFIYFFFLWWLMQTLIIFLFDIIIYSFFSLSYNEFTKYIYSYFTDFKVILIWGLEFLFVFICLPFLFFYIRSVFYKKNKSDIKNIYLLNIVVIDIICILLLLIWYYSWLVEYNYSIM